VVELVNCNVEVGNGRGRQHAHLDTVDLMVDEVTEQHAVVLHYYLHCFFYSLAFMLVPNFWLGRLRLSLC
jgi:hypothetical protein